MIVVDASVAFKWLRSKNEKYHDKAVSLLKNHLEDKEKIVVPQLLYLEIANALATKTRISTTNLSKNLDSLFDFELKKYSVKETDIRSAALLAKKYKTSVYDMLYAVSAKNLKCDLVTSDEKFIKKTGFSFARSVADIKIK